MYRWIVGCALAAFVLFIVFYPREATKTSYVNGLPPYTELPGKEYIFQQDCYVFKFKDANTDWPLVASSLTVPALPKDIDPKHIGEAYPNVRILETVSTGTVFRIVSVRRDQKAGQSKITYEIFLNDDASRSYPRLDAAMLLDHQIEVPGPVPMILSAYAVPRRGP